MKLFRYYVWTMMNMTDRNEFVYQMLLANAIDTVYYVIIYQTLQKWWNCYCPAAGPRNGREKGRQRKRAREGRRNGDKKWKHIAFKLISTNSFLGNFCYDFFFRFVYSMNSYVSLSGVEQFFLFTVISYIIHRCYRHLQ